VPVKYSEICLFVCPQTILSLLELKLLEYRLKFLALLFNYVTPAMLFFIDQAGIGKQILLFHSFRGDLVLTCEYF
jgi:hypothetical protein